MADHFDISYGDSDLDIARRNEMRTLLLDSGYVIEPAVHPPSFDSETTSVFDFINLDFHPMALGAEGLLEGGNPLDDTLRSSQRPSVHTAFPSTNFGSTGTREWQHIPMTEAASDIASLNDNTFDLSVPAWSTMMQPSHRDRMGIPNTHATTEYSSTSAEQLAGISNQYSNPGYTFMTISSTSLSSTGAVDNWPGTPKSATSSLDTAVDNGDEAVEAKNDDSIIVFDTDEKRWAAVISRDIRADGVFFYCVLSTKIFCRSICPARRPMRPNVSFVTTTSEAIEKGFRSCKRCKPDDVTDPNEEKQLRIVEQMKELLLQDNGTDKGMGVKDIAQEVGVSHWHLHRVFKSRVGTTPDMWARQERKARSMAIARGVISGANE